VRHSPGTIGRKQRCLRRGVAKQFRGLARMRRLIDVIVLLRHAIGLG
jgi:hypothetical protein